MILAIEPKTYKYIDKVAKGHSRVYGFITQQIRAIIPEATSIQTSYIPNIMLLPDYNDNVITLPSQPTIVIKQNDKIRCHNEENGEVYVENVEVIDELTFKVKQLGCPYENNKIFVYGASKNWRRRCRIYLNISPYSKWTIKRQNTGKNII